MKTIKILALLILGSLLAWGGILGGQFRISILDKSEQIDQNSANILTIGKWIDQVNKNSAVKAEVK